MKKSALILSGMLLSTGVMAGKPPPATCPCDFDALYDSSNPDAATSCFRQFSLSKSAGTEIHNLRWDVSGATYFAIVEKRQGDRSCRGTYLQAQSLSRTEYVACADALTLVADDADAALPDCNN